MNELMFKVVFFFGLAAAFVLVIFLIKKFAGKSLKFSTDIVSDAKKGDELGLEVVNQANALVKFFTYELIGVLLLSLIAHDIITDIAYSSFGVKLEHGPLMVAIVVSISALGALLSGLLVKYRVDIVPSVLNLKVFTSKRFVIFCLISVAFVCSQLYYPGESFGRTGFKIMIALHAPIAWLDIKAKQWVFDTFVEE